MNADTNKKSKKKIERETDYQITTIRSVFFVVVGTRNFLLISMKNAKYLLNGKHWFFCVRLELFTKKTHSSTDFGRV